MRILVEAYACSPGAASEPGLGWQYPYRFALLGHDVTVLTKPDTRSQIDAALADMPEIPVRFVYVAELDWPMRLGWTIGSALRYVLWLWSASRVAARLHAAQRFDLLHHASYGSLLGGSFLWRVPCPFAFGPVGGGQTAPDAFLDYFGPWRRTEVVRNVVVRHLWRLVWHAKRAARDATAVLVTNRETAELARRMGAAHVRVVRDIGMEPDFAPARPPDRSGRHEVRVLWLGRFLERKGLRLAVEAFEQLPPGMGLRLEILGAGYNERNHEATGSYLDEKAHTIPLEVHDRVPYTEIGRAYERADVFIFTGIRDSGGGQVLEAMAYGLPIVCLDHQGAGELVGASAGLRVPVTTPAETASSLAGALMRLATRPELRAELGQAAFERAKEFTWDLKASQVLAAVGMSHGKRSPGHEPLRAGSEER